jgi:hypothetical protein
MLPSAHYWPINRGKPEPPSIIGATCSGVLFPPTDKASEVAWTGERHEEQRNQWAGIQVKGQMVQCGLCGDLGSPRLVSGERGQPQAWRQVFQSPLALRRTKGDTLRRNAGHAAGERRPQQPRSRREEKTTEHHPDWLRTSKAPPTPTVISAVPPTTPAPISRSSVSGVLVPFPACSVLSAWREALAQSPVEVCFPVSAPGGRPQEQRTLAEEGRIPSSSRYLATVRRAIMIPRVCRSSASR